MMDAVVEVRCGAGYGEVSPDRVNSRNGYRRRERDTRAGTVELPIRKWRPGSSSPPFLWDRRRAERREPRHGGPPARRGLRDDDQLARSRACLEASPRGGSIVERHALDLEAKRPGCGVGRELFIGSGAFGGGEGPVGVRQDTHQLVAETQRRKSGQRGTGIADLDGAGAQTSHV